MERTRIYLITEYPFYAAMLNRCIVRWSTKIPTACIGLNGEGNPVMMVNKEFFYNRFIDEGYQYVGAMALGHYDLKHTRPNE